MNYFDLKLQADEMVWEKAKETQDIRNALDVKVQ
jgi:hypothetical protein